MLLSFQLFAKELFIQFSVRVFRERLSICVYASLLFGFGWDVGKYTIAFLFTYKMH